MEAIDLYINSCGTVNYAVQGALPFISEFKTSALCFSADKLRKILLIAHTCCQAPFLIFSSISFESAFVPRSAVTGLCYHGHHYYAIEVVWHSSTVCYGVTLGFKTGMSNQIRNTVTMSPHISKHRERG